MLLARARGGCIRLSPSCRLALSCLGSVVGDDIAGKVLVVGIAADVECMGLVDSEVDCTVCLVMVVRVGKQMLTCGAWLC